MNVLVIDDDPGVREAFTRILEKVQFDVTSVGAGVAAFAELKKQSFDAIVCDVILPVADGTSFYEELRLVYPEMASHVAFVTGWQDDEKVTRLLEYTGQPYLNKPVELDDLINLVRQVADDAEPTLQELGSDLA